jgi:hypothetical protein
VKKLREKIRRAKREIKRLQKLETKNPRQRRTILGEISNLKIDICCLQAQLRTRKSKKTRKRKRKRVFYCSTAMWEVK